MENWYRCEIKFIIIQYQIINSTLNHINSTYFNIFVNFTFDYIKNIFTVTTKKNNNKMEKYTRNLKLFEEKSILQDHEQQDEILIYVHKLIINNDNKYIKEFVLNKLTKIISLCKYDKKEKCFVENYSLLFCFNNENIKKILEINTSSLDKCVFIFLYLILEKISNENDLLNLIDWGLIYEENNDPPPSWIQYNDNKGAEQLKNKDELMKMIECSKTINLCICESLQIHWCKIIEKYFENCI